MKIGKNNFCFCGSGSIFKKYCLGKKFTKKYSKNIFFNVEEEILQHAELEKYSQARNKELIKIFSQELKVLDKYEQLICLATSVLGQIRPENIAD